MTHQPGVAAQPPASRTADPADPYLWLEEVTGDQALGWVRERNAETARELEGTPGYQALERDLLQVLDSEAKLPYVTKAGPFYYNFWRDAAHPRGLWRRTSLAEYRKDAPRWEVMLDVDALARAEKASWVFHGAQFLRPGFDRCLILLSPGGSDAHVVREFDLRTRGFVPDGFALPLAKSSVSWIDRDTLFVGTDFGPGSLTTSGYPRIVKRWRRGTALAQARTVFEGDPADMAVAAHHDSTKGFERDLVIRRPSFFTQEIRLLGRDGALTQVEAPADADCELRRQWLLIRLRSPWIVGARRYPAGALLVADLAQYLAGGRRMTVLFRPTASRSLEGWSWTRHHLILDVLADVKHRLILLTPARGLWQRRPFKGAPALGSVSVYGVDPQESDDVFMNVTDFLTPDSLYLGRAGRLPERLKSAPAFFDAAGLEISQHFAVSQDGTRVPYFQVAARGLALDGSHPALLTGYGGFEVSMLPGYSGVLGRGWLAKGGVYVVANIRGGGEYGPDWHRAALKRNRPRAYEDFAAVARDLLARKVTAVAHLGIEGGSNGGLLVGNMLTRYPELLGAVVCQVPLLDMRRYSHLLAGASWMEEYGDPDRPEDWAFLQDLSPYHTVRPGQAYPPVLFMTTTRDDRVHPGHARKMMAKMRAMGYDVRYFENTEGGHGAGADNRQTAHYWALVFAFLERVLR